MQPAPVLLSNAPPLLEGDKCPNCNAAGQTIWVVPGKRCPQCGTQINVHHASRVLQQHSANRQQTAFGLQDDYEPKSQPSDLTENTYARYSQQQSHYLQPHYRHSRRHPQTWHPYGSSRNIYDRLTPEQHARGMLEAARLFRRIQQSEQYVKYRNRQAKDDKDNGDQKWPDQLEEAFFQALVFNMPMGRSKMLHKDKQRGRNELIADYIYETTGVERSRKQVSSHIQVLKPFVENDPVIMRYLSKENLRAQQGKGPHALSYGGGRRMSGYPVTAPPRMIRNAVPTLPHTDAYGLENAKGNARVFEPTDFQMFVQRKYIGTKGHEEVERLHTYTQSVLNPLGPDLQMNDWQTMNRDFPLLASIHTQQRSDCNVLVAEASLAFPVETWKDKDGSPLPGVELGISFLCNSHHLSPTPKQIGSQVFCVTNFYENGVLAKDYSGKNEIKLQPSDNGDGVETQIKFGSTFWAKTLGRLAMRLLYTSKDYKDDVSAHLRGITVLQEVIVHSKHGAERILIMHWTCRHSSTTCGRASWRKLLLPSSQDPQSDMPEQTQRSDSMFDGYTQYAEAPTSQQQPQPALQSPFEYESSSGSALSSATWPSSISDGGIIGHQNVNADYCADNSFDFNAGSINITYDPNLTFDFDSSAFNFDTSAVDFAADPALQDYSQQWFEGQTTAFDVQQVAEECAAYGAQPNLQTQEHIYGTGYSGEYSQEAYPTSHDHQAYGGAGQDMTKDEDALAALADASYIASALGQNQSATY